MIRAEPRWIARRLLHGTAPSAKSPSRGFSVAAIGQRMKAHRRHAAMRAYPARPMRAHIQDTPNCAQHIKGAKHVEFPGIDHNPWVGDANSILGEIEAFLTGGRREIEPDLDRVLASVLFTDIVGATTRRPRMETPSHSTSLACS